ncbi:MAG: ATP-dependent DNA helicase [Candidatus Omnitrophota bacterium]|nr:ATP-dependent DNA helicase [Candidatus Omnitrophota bacterium]
MKEYIKFYNQLNPLQRSAVDAVEGPLLVLAGPGTGKTQLLSVRAGSILQSGKARPENILILTYTNSAAKAMKERLAAVIGPQGYDVEVGTFHSFANSIIQESEDAANYVEDRIQMDDVERMRVIEYILDNTKGVDDIRPFRAPYTYLKEILNKIGDLKKDGITPRELDDYLKDAKSLYKELDDKYVKRLRAFSIVYARYEELKAGKSKDIFDERGRYDFDDMIIFATEALKKETALREEYRDQYKYIMVDEYQDTNGAQLKLLFTLFGKKGSNLACVGDDDQSIYRFQGASVGNFKLLCKQFPGISVISLKENYRSSKELINISGRIINLIPHAERMGEKTLQAKKDYRNTEILFREFTTSEEELLYIVDKVRELKDHIEADRNLPEEERAHPYNNIAILVRKRSDILKIIDAFLKAGIPYATDGKEDISGEKRVKQLLDVLDLAYIDPGEHGLKDLALYKVLTADYFRIPHSDVLTFLSHVNAINAKKGKGRVTVLGELLRYFSRDDKELKFQESDRLKHAAGVIDRLLTDSRTRSVHTILMDFVKEAGIFKHILSEYDGNDILKIRQLRGLTSFVNMVKASDVANPAIRLDDFMLEMKTRKEHGLAVQGNLVTLTQAGVRVYTAHGSKGLEFNSVIIPFCLHNKNWPSRPRPDMIILPSDLFKSKEEVRGKEKLKELALQDETRLFYVAVTRAKSRLIFTASPTEDAVPSRYLSALDIAQESPENVKEEELLEKSLETTDLNDPFVGTEEVLKDMIGNLTLNPTRLNTYMTCRRKFLYNDVLKLPGPKKKSLVFGNCVHKALEDTYKAFMKNRKFPNFSFFLECFKSELSFQGVDEVMERDCLNKSDTLKGWFEIASKDPVMPIGLEKKLLITVGDNIIFTGKYDKVEPEDKKAGLVRILDYKTGKPDNHLRDIEKSRDPSDPECDGYLRQLVCYKLLFERDKKESRGMHVSHGALVFIEPVSTPLKAQGYKKGDYVTKSVAISDEMVDSLEELIKQAAGDIRGLRFEKLVMRDDKKCGMCDFDPICWG